MATAIWAGLALVALLWPSPLAGPYDGAPLDFALEASMAAAIVFAVWLRPQLIGARFSKALIVALLGWNLVASATASMDGWCLQFVSPIPLFRDTGRVPHSWDMRADWRTPSPRCSAILRRDYNTLEEFPVWFYNLPPVDEGSPAQKSDRPPLVTLGFNAGGYVDAPAAGTLRFETGEDVRLRLRVDDRDYSFAQAIAGVAVPAGVHRVSIDGELQRSHWSLRALWDNRNLWKAVTATTTPPTTLDRWLRPWAGYVPGLLVIAFLTFAAFSVVERAASPLALTLTLAAAVIAATMPFTGSPVATRVSALALFGPAFLPLPRRLQNGFGASLLIGIPFLAIFWSLGYPQIGVFTWYSSGDDWWMFQRYGYRIFMEGYWLEGGQLTFWFQPLYRWISGALHMVFGDSSVGELWWDASCAGVGGFFTFVITRRFSGFRWALVAAALTLTILLLGPAWYLFGRGLSEMSSMGFIYAAALTAIRARRGHVVAMIATAFLVTAAFYTRLNNLPMACAIVVFAFPTREPIFAIWRPSTWIRHASRPVVLSVLGGLAIAMWLFTWRTYHYTGFLDMFYGTQATDRAVWKPDDSFAQGLSHVVGSVMMVVTMSDPPTFDVRAIPVFGGMLAALAGVLGVGGLRRLPLGASMLALAGLTGAVVARGSAYPGRFSLHLIPASVAIFMCAVSITVNAIRPKAAPHARQPPGTT